MKRLIKYCSLFAIVLCLGLCLFACGEDKNEFSGEKLKTALIENGYTITAISTLNNNATTEDAEIIAAIDAKTALKSPDIVVENKYNYSPTKSYVAYKVNENGTIKEDSIIWVFDFNSKTEVPDFSTALVSAKKYTQQQTNSYFEIYGNSINTSTNLEIKVDGTVLYSWGK